MIDEEWWRGFFTGPWSTLQQAGYPAGQTAAECDLIGSVLRLAPGARVLDIPCGRGRHALEFARRGFRVTGVDFNADAIAAARAAAQAESLPADFVVADMRRFASPERFDGVSCFFGSFGYFSDEGNLEFARAMAASLRPGGRCLIEGHLQETLLPIFRAHDSAWTGAPGASALTLEDRTWDPATRRVDVVFTLVDDAGARSASSSVRLYEIPELRELLRRAGFASVELLDGTTGQPFGPQARRALVVAGT
jgi:SAM-dependent methyltransferase